ncbi:MAG TPA: SxtJ family membrane protein [Sedimentisphaerales bacterium]|nr:SxtJ family membrane protein [Sedimentisphaerales bacterium]
MALMEVEWHPTPRQLRVFGLAGLAASIVAAPVLHYVWGIGRPWPWVVLAAGAGIFLCSLISQRATRLLYVGLTLVALPIGFVVSYLLLGAFYFLLLTPLALVFRLIGRDAMRRTYDPQAPSYWIAHAPAENMERYLRQF